MAQRNTDGRFWAYRTVATSPDSTGKHRVNIIPLSELYDWSPEALAEVIARAGRPAVLLGPMDKMTWDAFNIVRVTGYADAGTTEAPWLPGAWRAWP